MGHVCFSSRDEAVAATAMASSTAAVRPNLRHLAMRAGCALDYSYVRLALASCMIVLRYLLSSRY
jgi:hypothetical protein